MSKKPRYFILLIGSLALQLFIIISASVANYQLSIKSICQSPYISQGTSINILGYFYISIYFLSFALVYAWFIKYTKEKIKNPFVRHLLAFIIIIGLIIVSMIIYVIIGGIIKASRCGYTSTFHITN